jgi:restriction endonuclease S subunit
VAKVFKDCVTISARGTIGYTVIRQEPFVPIVRLIVAIPDKNKVNLKYFKYILDTINIYKNGNSIPQLTIPMIKTEKVPVPSLNIQEELVKEMESQEKIIEYNKKLIEIMENKINIVLNQI